MDILKIIGIEVQNDTTSKEISECAVRILGKDLEPRIVSHSLENKKDRKQGYKPSR